MIRLLIVTVLFLGIPAFAQLIPAKIVVQQMSHDFGDINQGDIVTHTFVISNSGGDILKISNVKASCGCTAAKPEKDELKPGESTNISVTFNSKGRKGPQSKTVTVTTNDIEKPNTTLTIKCNVVVNESQVNNEGAKIYFPNTQHDFGKVKEGGKLDYTFTFENRGTLTLQIKDVKTSCGCTAAVVSESSIKPGQSGSIKVEFDTKNRSGRNSKTITVVSNDPKEPNKILTIFADIQKN